MSKDTFKSSITKYCSENGQCALTPQPLCDLVSALTERYRDYCVVTGDESKCPACIKERKIAELRTKLLESETMDEASVFVEEINRVLMDG